MENEIRRRITTLRKVVPAMELEGNEYQRLDEKYGLLSKALLKKKIKDIFIAIVFCFIYSCEEVVDKLAHYGKIFLDVNGLKSVNDLAGHENGDILLDRIIDCLKNNAKINNFIETYSLKVEYFKEGGDEFSLLVFSANGKLTQKISRPIDEGVSECIREPGILEALREIIVEEVSEIKIDDFFGKEIIDNLDEYGQELYKATSGNYVATASIAGSDISFDQVFLRCVNDKFSKVLVEDCTQNMVGDNLMGSVQNLTDAMARVYKDAYKMALLESDDSCEVFEGYLITRSNEAKRLFIKIKKLKKHAEKTFQVLSASLRDSINSQERILASIESVSDSPFNFEDEKLRIKKHAEELNLVSKNYAKDIEKLLS